MKTTIASMFPNAVICSFEMGIRSQAVNYIETYTWEAFIEFVDNLEKNRMEIGSDISTIVIDTINKAEEVIEPYILKKYSRLDGKKYLKPNDIPYGGFYTAKDREMRTQIDRIERMGFTILYLTHSRLKTVTPKNGDPYEVYVSAMSDRCEKFIYPSVDYILYGEKRMVDDGLGNKVEKRVFITKGGSGEVVGSRVHFNEDIVFDTEEEAIEKFQEQFKKTIEERLRKAGITRNIDDIAKEQEAERMEKAKQYIEEAKKPTKDEMIETIKDKFMKATEQVKAKVLNYLKTEAKVVSFQNPDAFTTQQLEDIIEMLECTVVPTEGEMGE